MNRLKSIINSMSYEELKQIKNDISEGNLINMVNQKIKILEKYNNDKHICPVCGEKLYAENTKYTLVFGQEGVKKKASFCEIDCLQFFISQFKNAIKRC